MAETTLILLKPDCIAKGLCGEVLKRFESNDLKIRGIRMLQMDDALAREHYAHVADKPFFPGLAEFMGRTPIIAVALEGDDSIATVRKLLGPTDSKEAPAGTIRGDYGEDVQTNVVHASDSPENAEIELKRFFGEGRLFDY